MIEREQAVLTGSGVPGHAGVCYWRERDAGGKRSEWVAHTGLLLECKLSLKYLGCTFSVPFPRGIREMVMRVGLSAPSHLAI